MRTLVQIVGVVVVGMLALSLTLLVWRGVSEWLEIGDEPGRIVETGTVQTVP